MRNRTLNIVDDVITVKILLRGEEMEAVLLFRDGDRFEQEFGGPTDEGFWHQHETYFRDGATIYREISTRSRDCDGPHGTEEFSEWQPHLGVNHNGWPRWSYTVERHRDEFAIQAGY